MRKLLFVGAGLLLVVGLAIVSLQLLSSKGWSKDLEFDDGRMGMLVQFKVEPDPPTIGRVDLMAKVKNPAGYPMAVDHVHFEINANGQRVSDTLEGDPVGNFSASGNGFYRATVGLPSAGSYEVGLLVKHRESSFNSNWPLEVK